MFRLLIKDLRVSPMRTFLTGFSMFVGIISMIAAVLAGTLGRDALQAVNAQIYGYAPIYAMSVSGMQLRDSEKMEHFFELLERIPGDTMLETNCKDDIQFVSLKQLEDLENKREFLYRKLTFTDNVFTTSAYNRMYNIPVSEGRWFCDSDETAGMEIVVNKAAAQLFPTSYMAASLSGTLALIPFNKVGVVNDGKDWPVVYVNIQPLLYRMPEIFTAENAMLYYHGENMGLEKIQSCIEDVLFDSVEGRITNASVMANGERYDSVIALLQMGLSISAMLLLFVSILGQINIGLASGTKNP